MASNKCTFFSEQFFVLFGILFLVLFFTNFLFKPHAVASPFHTFSSSALQLNSLLEVEEDYCKNTVITLALRK